MTCSDGQAFLIKIFVIAGCHRASRRCYRSRKGDGMIIIVQRRGQTFFITDGVMHKDECGVHKAVVAAMNVCRQNNNKQLIPQI